MTWATQRWRISGIGLPRRQDFAASSAERVDVPPAAPLRVERTPALPERDADRVLGRRLDSAALAKRRLRDDSGDGKRIGIGRGRAIAGEDDQAHAAPR